MLDVFFLFVGDKSITEDEAEYFEANKSTKLLLVYSKRKHFYNTYTHTNTYNQNNISIHICTSYKSLYIRAK